MGLPSIDDNWWDDSGLPEAITAEEPICPRCGLAFDMPDEPIHFHNFDCNCGYRFEAERKQMIVSRPIGIQQ